jgi:hypothetical protein
VQGLIQNQPLLLSWLLKHAERFYAGTEIVSSVVEGPIHRYGHCAAARLARKLANVLRHHGMMTGDRVDDTGVEHLQAFRDRARSDGPGDHLAM